MTKLTWYEQNQTKHDRIRNRNHHLKGNAKPADTPIVLSQLGVLENVL